MYEIIQTENDCVSIIDSKETQGEAEDYVSALNEMHEQEQIQFYYRLNTN